MKMNLMSSSWLRAKRSTAAFAVDCRAVAAVELAVIAPLMLLLFFGTVEISSAVAIDRKVTLVAHTLADLISRSTTVTDADLANFFRAGDGIMYPYPASTVDPASPLKSTISELYVEPDTLVARVQWSTGAAPRAAKYHEDHTCRAAGRRQLFDLQRGQLHIHAGGAVDPAGWNHAER
jgi:Flp pilus assembly protein TadG